MTPSFKSLVEKRARDKWRAARPHLPADITWDMMDQKTKDKFLASMRNDIILSWAAANPTAVEALCEGRAAVVTMEVACNAKAGAMSVLATLKVLAYKPSDSEPGEPLHRRNLEDVRLDKPIAGGK